MRVSNIPLLLVSATLSIANALLDKDNHIENLFEKWTKSFGREYPTDEERMKKMAVWIDNHGMRWLYALELMCLHGLAICNFCFKLCLF